MSRTSQHFLLLFRLSLVPVFVFQSKTMVVQRGKSITLQCSNVSSVVGHVAWFKQVNRSEPVCISVMYGSHPSTLQNYFDNGLVNMHSNNTTIFLEILKVEIADSGLYFCGFFTNTKYMVFVNATFLNVQGPGSNSNEESVKKKCNGTTGPGGECNGTTSLVGECNGTTCLVGECNGTTSPGGVGDGTMKMNPWVVILGCVTAVLLIVIIILVHKIRRGTKTDIEDQLQRQNSQVACQDTNSLTYSALSFSQKRPINKADDDDEMSGTGTYVVYSATR